MPQMLVAVDLPVGRPVAASRPFGLSLRDGGVDAAWVRVEGELDIATALRLEQTLPSAELSARAETAAASEIIDLNASEPPVPALGRITRSDQAA